MLAQARDTLPPPSALPGDLVFQPKWDGHRAILFTPCPAPGPVLLQSRRGALIHARFPDLVRAAAALPDGLVLDGELIVWSGGSMSFEALQRRAVSSGPPARRGDASALRRLQRPPDRRPGAAAHALRRQASPT
ncbi:hypothetical protein ABZ785_10075 [Streptomyces incarnatus]